MSRHSNDQTLKEAIEDMLRNFKLEDRFKQIKLIDSWSTIMGSTVANRTTEIKLVGKKLIIVLNSASLRQELFQEREKIVELLNEKAGGKVVDEVVFK